MQGVFLLDILSGWILCRHSKNTIQMLNIIFLCKGFVQEVHQLEALEVEDHQQEESVM